MIKVSAAKAKWLIQKIFEGGELQFKWKKIINCYGCKTDKQ